MTTRVLRYAAGDRMVTLSSNAQHELARQHSISIYGANAIYSMIPKNACSSLRISVALANGAIDSEQSWRWIHANNQTFIPALRDLATAHYTFTFLRCPFARLVSCFMDKIVSRTADAWQFQSLADDDIDLARLTFRRFCVEMANPRVKHSNIHWRPQVDFLVYKSYDDLFCIENFAAATDTLWDKIGLRVVDSRPYVRHDSSHYQTLPLARSYADTEVWQLEAMMMNGLRPDPASLYDGDLRQLVEAAYAEDFKLYNQLFRGFGLFDRAREDGQQDQRVAAAS